ncbi:MAG: serine hydrolase domain-containing protein [Clostridiaceae bacterium]
MKHINRFLFFLVLICTFLSTFNSYNANAEEINNEDLSKFLNNITKESFEKYSLPSLCVIVVKDGKVVYENALGSQDIENNIKADVNNTTYRTGSISKLFTATAIMQLYQEGKVDLKEDVNKYLKDIKIENKFSKKVTIESLLTHTSGIDEATPAYGISKTEENMLSLSEFLKKHPPVVVTEPGTVCLYSNIGMDILGNIIENVTGMKYAEYIQKNIFDVLEMKNSNAALPLINTAKNYDELVPSGYYYFNDNPAGGINASPADMAKFMISYLQNGVYKNNRILNEDTVKLMEQRHFSNDNNLAGVGYGFWQKDINGNRVIGHEGALSMGYYNDMLLYPEENLGIYMVSNNLTKAALAIAKIENAFFNKYYKNDKTTEFSNNIKSSDDISRYEGVYRSYHDNAKSNIFKFITFMGALDENEDVTIDYDKDKNQLVYHGISHLKEKEDVPLIQVADNLFRREDDNQLVAFREEEDKVKYVFFNSAPFDSFERVEFKDGYNLNLVILAVSVIFFSFNILKSLFSLFKNLFKIRLIFNLKRNNSDKISESKVFKLIIFIISLINMVSLALVLYWMMSFDMFFSDHLYIRIALICLIVNVILSVAAVILFSFSIRNEKTKISYKILGIIRILILFAFIFFIYNWNLI